jgi:hypothetical protein
LICIDFEPTSAKALIYFGAYIAFFLSFYYLVPALGVRAKGDRTRRILGIHNSPPGPVTNSLWAFGAKYDLILVLQDRT